MTSRLMRVFSGSCMSLDDQDSFLPQLIPRNHELGPGVDHFDETGIPQRPQTSCHAMTKVFSGSALDLAAMNPDEEEDEDSTPSLNTASDGTNSDQTLSVMMERNIMESARQKEMKDKSKITVLVVGGAGFLGSHIVSKLLDEGYTVKATVATTAQVKELFTGVTDAHRLTVAEVNMRSAVGFKDILRGCHFVIHCGVPSVGLNDNIVEVHVQTIKALFDSIRMYAKNTVKRVILTGAAATVCSNQTAPLPNGAVFDETHWNDKVTEQNDPFVAAKCQFEKEAWRLQKLHDIELVVMLPSIMVGPSFTQEVSEAMRLIQGLALQSNWFPFAPNMIWSFVDVRDVALAHVSALEAPKVGNQRYIVNGHMASLPQLGQLIRQAHPHLLAPVYTAPNLLTFIMGPLSGRVPFRYLWNNLGKRRPLSNKKAEKDLGLTVRGLDETIKDALSELIAAGHLPSPNDPSQVVAPVGGLAVISALVAAASIGTYLLMRRRK